MKDIKTKRSKIFTLRRPNVFRGPTLAARYQETLSKKLKRKPTISVTKNKIKPTIAKEKP